MAKVPKSPVKEASSAATRKEPVPLHHVAIIMDGNRRWADRRGLPRLFGHKAGVKALKALVKHVTARKLDYLTVYAFSSENWQRGAEEVDYLMQLFNEVLRFELDELAKGGARLRFIGDLGGMPEDLQTGLYAAMEKTRRNSGLHLQVALNYGSRLEISQAVRQIARDVQAGVISEESINPQLIGRYLYTGDMPDPDLIIRTGGEMRLSNYLLWQAAYTELYVTETMWPDFSPQNFDEAIVDYAARQRRYGGG